MLNWMGRCAPIARLRGKIIGFKADKRGNVAVISALASLPMIAGVGCVIDYSMASMVKTKLQAAADAAALATVSVNSSAVTTALGMPGSGTVSGGSTYATNFFNANLSTSPENTGYSNLSSSATVTRSGTTISAQLTFGANVPTFFMKVMGHGNIAVNGTSSASATLPIYINFYLMLDVSGSMSFPSTNAEQTRLQSVNPDYASEYPNGCTFACHHPDGSEGFTITRLGTSTPTGGSVNWGNTPVTTCPTAGTTSCIQLRGDSVGYAVTTLLSTAAAAEQVPNQYKVGLYPFIQYLSTSYFSLTTNLTATGPGTINYAATQRPRCWIREILELRIISDPEGLILRMRFRA
jgi:Flp pilus assembly protein TadG